MAKSIEVVIGGKTYSLLGDDVDLIRTAAGEVDVLFEEMMTKHKSLPYTTVSVLAALNLAEQNLKSRQQIEVDKHFFIDEINKMAEFLESEL